MRPAESVGHAGPRAPWRLQIPSVAAGAEARRERRTRDLFTSRLYSNPHATAIRTATEYQAALLELKRLITTAPDGDTAIATLAGAVDDYEIKASHGPVRPDTLIGRLEIEMFNRQQMVELLGISASRLSDLLNGKTSVTMSLAKKLHKTLNIPADFILEAA